MANAHKAEVEITLDRVRRIRLDMNAICEAEQTLGSDLINNNPIGHGFRGIRAVLFHGLRHEDPSLTLEKTGELMDTAKMPVVTAAVIRAWNLALTGGETDKAEESSPNAQTPAPAADGAGESK